MEMDLGKWIFASSLVIASALIYPVVQTRMDLAGVGKQIDVVTKKAVDAKQQNNIVAAQTTLKTLQTTADIFLLDHGRLPKDMDELAGSSGGVIGYLPQDPWGYPYIMQVNGKQIAFKSEGLDKALAN